MFKSGELLEFIGESPILIFDEARVTETRTIFLKNGDTMVYLGITDKMLREYKWEFRDWRHVLYRDRLCSIRIDVINESNFKRLELDKDLNCV